jgi:D-glycero-D-manno-heptose 1,7-bisphosphate phosphatase
MEWLKEIDNTWTLFLDRDGVINKEISGDYVRTIEQLHLYPNVANNIALFNKLFNKVVIITNQRCVGKGIITANELAAIHTYLQKKLAEHGAHIDAIFYADDIQNDAPNRKPQIGMALQAVQQIPSINLSKTIMVGNSKSDIQFANNAGTKAIFVTTTKPVPLAVNIDAVFNTLNDFALALQQCFPTIV